jgi:hypothetical protein
MAEDRVTLDQVPEKARHLLAVVEAYRREPFIAQHFHQVTWLSLNTSLGERGDFFALEFRSGKNVALLWSDAQGNWRAGKWLALSSETADVSAAAGFSPRYFEGVYAYNLFTEALHFVAVTKPG